MQCYNSEQLWILGGLLDEKKAASTLLFTPLNAPLLAFLLATQDTIFYMVTMSLTWMTSWLPIYYCLYHLQWAADKFWFILIFDQLIVFFLYAYRVYFLNRSFKASV